MNVAQFPDICLTVEEKTSTTKVTQPGTEPGPTQQKTKMLPLDHSSGKEKSSLLVHCDYTVMQGSSTF